VRSFLFGVRDRELIGYCAAVLAVLIFASYPVATRAGVMGTFSPQDLVLLRFGVGTLCFLPYLVLHFSGIERDVWVKGIALALFQGAGMAGLVICGLQFAPANHAAALGPGISAAWVAVLGFLIFARRPSARVIIGIILCSLGVVALTCSSATGVKTLILAGDSMFVGASALGALYALNLRKWAIGAMPGAAIVTLYSGLVVVPWYLLSGSTTLLNTAPAELLWQVLWQGVLIGCVALIALNLAIGRLGSERSTVLVALVPALSTLLGLLFLGEIPSTLETAGILTISAGVLVGAFRPMRVVRQLAAHPQT